MCRSQAVPAPKERRKKRTFHKLDFDDPTIINNLKVFGATKHEPSSVKVFVQQVPLSMELDTGAAAPIISKKQFAELFPTCPVQKSDLRLRTHTGELVCPYGVSKVEVCHDQQTCQLPLYILEESGPALLGRE